MKSIFGCEFCSAVPAPYTRWLYPDGAIQTCAQCKDLPLVQMLDILAARDEIAWNPKAQHRPDLEIKETPRDE